MGLHNNYYGDRQRPMESRRHSNDDQGSDSNHHDSQGMADRKTGASSAGQPPTRNESMLSRFKKGANGARAPGYRVPGLRHIMDLAGYKPTGSLGQ